MESRTFRKMLEKQIQRIFFRFVKFGGEVWYVSKIETNAIFAMFVECLKHIVVEQQLKSIQFVFVIQIYFNDAVEQRNIT